MSSSPEPELEPSRGEEERDRYEVTTAEGDDGQPKIDTGPQLMDIFGDDSDLTEQSDSDDDDQEDRRSPAPARRSRSPSEPRSASPRSPSPTGPAHDPDEDEGEEYREEDEGERDAKLNKMKIKKKKRAEGDNEEPRPRKSKKKSRAQVEEQREEEPEEIDPETRRRLELRARIDAAAKSKGGRKGGKKKKAQDEEDIEMMNDEAVATLRSKMLQAADRDIEENDNGRPAVHKLRMLPQVVDLMQKTALAETIVEGGMLEAVKRWLEPLPDKSLPALNIQRPLFNILRSFTIETSALKSSGLGRIVYFYTKCQRVDPAIARLANQLVSDWMRPILRRSKAFVDREVDAAGTGHARFGSSSHIAAQRLEKAAAEAGGGGAGAQRRARIPQAMTATFSVAPQSTLTGSGAAASGGGAASQARMREYKKKIQISQLAARRV
ncbi:hypothetical protein JCM10212_002742 [Sporobolomyces blumeae]